MIPLCGRALTVMLLITVCAFISVSAQNMLRNGDAQDSSAAGAFASHAGSSVSIVDDPYDEKGENKCWYICPDDGLTSKVWSYFWQYGPVFEPGESYLIEMDVAVGKDSSGNAINNYSGINLNMHTLPSAHRAEKTMLSVSDSIFPNPTGGFTFQKPSPLQATATVPRPTYSRYTPTLSETAA